jgi:hypothetical protein
MSVSTRAILIAAALFGVALSPPSRAVELYVGAGLVQADARLDQPTTSIISGFRFKEQNNSWKAVVGVRALSLFGAELEYIDLGNVSSGPLSIGSTPIGEIHGSVKATSVFGLLYLPIPAPLVDVYGKAGYARINAKATTAPTGGIACPATPPTPWYCAPARSSSLDDNAPAAGIGVRVKLGSWGVRGEYEVLMPKGPDTSIISLTVVKLLL